MEDDVRKTLPAGADHVQLGQPGDQPRQEDQPRPRKRAARRPAVMQGRNMATAKLRAQATCSIHLEDALLWLSGRVVRVRQVNDPATYMCHCDQPARWFLTEISVLAPGPIVPVGR